MIYFIVFSGDDLFSLSIAMFREVFRVALKYSSNHFRKQLAYQIKPNVNTILSDHYLISPQRNKVMTATPPNPFGF